MEARAIQVNDQTISVSKRDLMEAWGTLEKVVVSLRKMGSYYATPDEHTPLPFDKQQEMYRELDTFLSGKTWRELAHARRLLVEYLPEEETEEASEHSIEYWRPGDAGRAEERASST